MDLQLVRPITLEDQALNRWVFNPQSDITPLEVALCCQLFIKLVMTVWHGPVDAIAYVRDNKLERHFNGPLPPLLTGETTLSVSPTSRPGVSVDVEGSFLAGLTVEGLKESAQPIGSAAGLKLVSIMAQQDLPGGTAKGTILTIPEGYPIPEGWILAPADALEKLAAAGGVR